MDADAAIRRLAFVEARSTSAEALVAIARHRAELTAVTEPGAASEAAKADNFAERARSQRKLDKTA
ncbi:MAG: hypothetical protein HY834_18555 [Devosia nanyangense]|uniref:Uncharacterized protein n=1 Tax=Devosia nanyangense TaxID=1228055 RepID=A0A933L3X3_9HYPH|nr:hypothetical protein [Devosia nanyangense]